MVKDRKMVLVDNHFFCSASTFSSIVDSVWKSVRITEKSLVWRTTCLEGQNLATPPSYLHKIHFSFWTVILLFFTATEFLHLNWPREVPIIALPDLDSDTDSDFDSRPIVLCRTCSHCTYSGSDPYCLFLHGIGIWVCTHIRVRQCV